MKYVLFLVLVLSLGMGGRLEAITDIAAGCKNLLESVGVTNVDEKLGAQEESALIVGEQHSLSELLVTGPDSLIAKSPWLIMNAAQKAYDLIRLAGEKQIFDLTSTNPSGRVNVYELFSGGTPLTDGKFIAGQRRGIEQLVKNIKGRADDTRTSLSVVLLEGAPGTGKSMTLEILRDAFRNATTSDPSRYAYTYEWVNLSEFLELKGRIPGQYLKEGSTEGLMGDRFDSPFVLLPKVIQDAVLKSHEKVVVNRINRKPQPKLWTPDPKSKLIRDKILDHYTKKKGKPLTAVEVVNVLNKHVRIRRLILGNGMTCPIISAQSKDVDMGTLLAKKDPLATITHGTAEATSWSSGKIVKASGGVVFFDEAGKNEPYLLRTLLNLMQAHSVNVEGSPEYELDILFIGATNRQDIKKIMSSDPESPFMDRITVTPWDHLVQPAQIGQLVLGQNMKNLEVRKLSPGEDFKKPTEGQVFNEIFPERTSFTEAPLMAHRRYALQLNNGITEPITIAPLALEFAASVMAISRSSFDPEKYKGTAGLGIIASHKAQLRDPQHRLRALWGDPTVSQEIMRELALFSQGSLEGTFGLMHRDWERWFDNGALMEAQREGGGNTITPLTLFQALNQGINGDSILKTQPELKSMALAIARMVLVDWVAPKVREDLQLAMAESEESGVVTEHYRQFIEETIALDRSPSARTYQDSKSGQTPINSSRREAIIKIFERDQQRSFVPSEVISWMASFVQLQQRAGEYEPLRNAIAAWYSEGLLQREGGKLNRLLAVASDPQASASSGERARAVKFMDTLREKFGYNEFAAREAMTLLQNIDSARTANQQK